ncbi:hypothetical protein NC652_000297 [Populus alba x Populus x berolinensis]|nr:hypothetical protein NC652_000297 [Populus alba x Populus x berolinensis]
MGLFLSLDTQRQGKKKVLSPATPLSPSPLVQILTQPTPLTCHHDEDWTGKPCPKKNNNSCHWASQLPPPQAIVSSAPKTPPFQEVDNRPFHTFHFYCSYDGCLLCSSSSNVRWNDGAEDFHHRVSSSGGVRYIFQLQNRSLPHDEVTCDIALDCTRPWDESEFPYIDMGEVPISPEGDVIRATSSSQSASSDHGRLLIYEICQHWRNEEPIPEAWRLFREQSDVKVDLSGCPMTAALEKKDSGKVTLAKT